MSDPNTPAVPDAPDLRDDVDLALRHLSQRFPDDLARALLPDARSLTGCTWTDTQLTARQRRMDRGLLVVADGRRRVEHVEWQTRWERDLTFRVYEYHTLQSLALHEAASGGERVPRVRSTVVLLGGREEPWPAQGAYRTSPEGERFSGVRFRIEAVYQRTLAELRDRKSALWMVFAPLAIDATPDAMPAVVRDLRKHTPRARFEELAVAMAVLADADVRKRGLREVIATQLPEELVMQSWIYKQGLAAGIEKGRDEGIVRGEVKALRDAIEMTLSSRSLRLSPTRRAQLTTETRTDVLQSWFKRALTADRASDVFAEP